MDQDTANLIVPCLIVMSIIIYPISVKAYLMSWLDHPSIGAQSPIRIILLALAAYISLNAETDSRHSFMGYVLLISILIFPVIFLAHVSGVLGEIISEKLFPEFEAKKADHKSSSESDDD